MGLGTVTLALGLNDKEFKSQMKRVDETIADFAKNMKKHFDLAKIGQYLMDGAGRQAREELKLVQTQISSMAEGMKKEHIDILTPLVNQFDFLGASIDQAAAALYKFVLSNQTRALEQLGIFLTKDTKAMLSQMDAAQRLEWALQNIPDRLKDIYDQLSPTTKLFYEFEKRAADVKKALGTAFLGVINNVVNALGGVQNAMKTAIIAFTAYKVAMILGNVGIGISKAIAIGSVFSAPIAIGMGIAALGAIGTLIGGAALAINAINSIPSFDDYGQQTPNLKPNVPDNNGGNIIDIRVSNDRFGQLNEVVTKRNGFSFNSIQTNFGNR